jgi:hypothetical protein
LRGGLFPFGWMAARALACSKVLFLLCLFKIMSCAGGDERSAKRMPTRAHSCTDAANGADIAANEQHPGYYCYLCVAFMVEVAELGCSESSPASISSGF